MGAVDGGGAKPPGYHVIGQQVAQPRSVDLQRCGCLGGQSGERVIHRERKTVTWPPLKVSTRFTAGLSLAGQCRA